MCCRCISDVQVTLRYPNGKTTYHDAVKKTHSIGPKMLIAFAGSIKLAFSIVDLLRTDFYKNLDERLFDKPNLIAEKAAKFIKYNYGVLSKNESDSLELLLLLAPKSKFGSYSTAKLVSPVFTPQFVVAPNLAQIGSGSNEAGFDAAVKENSTWGFESSDPDGGELPMLTIPVGPVAMRWIAATAVDFQVQGVSKALHISMLAYQTISIDEFPAYPDAEFPQTAETWDDLVRYLGSKGETVAECQALA